MARLFVILLVVIAIWTGIEVYTRGVDGAFGGVFKGVSSELEAPAARSSPDRAADAFQRAYNKSETRVDELLREPDAGR
jgi:hypothetical protein